MFNSKDSVALARDVMGEAGQFVGDRAGFYRIRSERIRSQ